MAEMATDDIFSILGALYFLFDLQTRTCLDIFFKYGLLALMT